MNTVAVIGAGNVANSLVPALKKSGVEITEIFSRTCEHAKSLAEKVNAKPVASITDLAYADFYILSVPDNNIEETVAALPVYDNVILHVSGSVEIKILEPYCAGYGVMYPFQTFSAAKPINEFSDIPVFIEANSEKTLCAVKTLAEKISNKVSVLSSAERVGLHVAAVFSCNFFNHLLTCAFDICREYGVNPQVLKLLTEETMNKAFTSNCPEKMQTGPAKRRDMKTVEKHLDLLKNSQDFYRIYKTMTDSILDKKQ